MPPRLVNGWLLRLKGDRRLVLLTGILLVLQGSSQRGQGRGRGRSASGVEVDSVYEHLFEKLDRIKQQLETLVGLVADQLQQQQQRQQHPAPMVKSEAIPPEQNPNQHGKYMVASLHEFMECDPPSFAGTDPDSDPTEFLEKSNKICVAVGCSPVRAVELVSFMLRDIAYDWFASLIQRRRTGDPPLEWPEFSKAFLERFFPRSLQYAKAREFEQLRQTSGMSVRDYDIQFTRLSRYAPHHVATEQLRARWFVDGLQDNLSIYLTISETSTYCQVLDAALLLELGGRERQTKRGPYKKARFE